MKEKPTSSATKMLLWLRVGTLLVRFMEAAVVLFHSLIG